MPRNSGTGVYSPPPNINAVSGAPIESADWNAKIQDDATIFNSPWPVGLGGTGVTSLTGFLATLGGLPLAGGALTGPLTLSGDATAALQPVTKQQFDAGLATKAATSHTHTASQITDFSGAADARIGAASINSLVDVIITAAASGHVLYNNGTNWVNRAPYTEYNKGALVNGGVYTQAHGLGAKPSKFEVYARCNTANNGYAVGDDLPLFSVCTEIYYLSQSMTATTCSVKIKSAITFLFLSAATQSEVTLTGSQWDVVFRVFP